MVGLKSLSQHSTDEDYCLACAFVSVIGKRTLGLAPSAKTWKRMFVGYLIRILKKQRNPGLGRWTRASPLGSKFAGDQVNDSVALASYGFIVCHHHDGQALLAIQLHQQVEDLQSRIVIQVSGRFVSQQ